MASGAFIDTPHGKSGTPYAAIVPHGKRKGMTMTDEKDDGWIEWNGGECPVADDTKIDVKLRGEFEFGMSSCRVENPTELRWDHMITETFAGRGDIIAYRVVQP